MNLLFKALNDDTRRQILELLKEDNLTAGQIADAFNISKPSISHFKTCRFSNQREERSVCRICHKYNHPRRCTPMDYNFKTIEL